MKLEHEMAVIVTFKENSMRIETGNYFEISSKYDRVTGIKLLNVECENSQ